MWFLDNLRQFHWVDFQLYMTAWHFGRQTPTQEPFRRIDRWETCWPPASSTTPTLLRYRAKKTSGKSFGTAVIPYDTPSFLTPRQDPNVQRPVGVAWAWVGELGLAEKFGQLFFWKFPFLQTCGNFQTFLDVPVKKNLGKVFPIEEQQIQGEEFFWALFHLQEVWSVFQVFVYIIFYIRIYGCFRK